MKCNQGWTSSSNFLEKGEPSKQQLSLSSYCNLLDTTTDSNSNKLVMPKAINLFIRGQSYCYITTRIK